MKTLFGQNYLKVFKMKFYMVIETLMGSLILWIVYMMEPPAGGDNGS